MLGEQLKEIRKHFDISQQKFATTLDLSVNGLANYEQNKRFPTSDLLIKITKLYNINGHWLLTGEGKMSLEDCEIGRKINEKDAEFWMHNWGNRLRALQKKFNYSDETMADLLGIKLIKYLDYVCKNLYPEEKVSNAIKNNFIGFTLDEILYDENKTFMAKLDKNSDDKVEIDLKNLSPEQRLKLNNLLKGI